MDRPIHLRCRTGRFVLLEDSLRGCLGRQASALSVPWQAASEGKTDRLEACRPGQARHGTSPSDWRTGCLTSEASLPGRFCFARIRLEGRALSGQSGYRPQAGGYRDDLFVVATALCDVKLFMPAPHPSDRPQAGGYTGKPDQRIFFRLVCCRACRKRCEILHNG